MIDNPSFQIKAEIALHDTIQANPADHNTIGQLLPFIRDQLNQNGYKLAPLSIIVEQSIPTHHGLGSGTQRSFAIGKLSATLAGCKHLTISQIALLSNRFPRSGVGAHGFDQGGLILDGGHTSGLGHHQELAPLIHRAHWPAHWRVILITPHEPAGVYGTKEMKLFTQLPPPSSESMNLVAKTIHSDFLNALASTEFLPAMNSLELVQHQVGKWFAPAQRDSVYGSPLRDSIIKSMNSSGLRGVGQSSWGPTLFGFSQSSDTEIQSMIDSIKNQHPEIQFNILITTASNTGHRLESE
jgi:beta-RFAP synthase